MGPRRRRTTTLVSRPVPVVPVEVAIVSGGLIASPVTALAAADHALRLRVATAEAIETALTEVKPGAQGVGAVRRALQIADARRVFGAGREVMA